MNIIVITIEVWDEHYKLFLYKYGLIIMEVWDDHYCYYYRSMR